MSLSPPAFTPKAFIVGALLCIAIGVGTPYGALMIQGTDMALTANTPAAFFLLFVWVLFLQAVLRLINRRLPLGRGELIVVFVMMIVGTAVTTRGFTGMLFATISGPLYYATPENGWAEQILPYIPSWMIPQDDRAIRYFYEGLPANVSLPWLPWVEPVFWWLVFIGGFYLSTICLMVVLRRQWVEHERLIYPLAQVALAMMPEEGGDGLLPPVFKRTLFWVGLILSFIANSFTALHNHFFFFPTLELASTVSLFRDSVGLGLRLSFLMLGFSYFIQANVAVGLWVFYLLRVAELGILEVLGITVTERLAPFSGGGGTIGILGHQTTGAVVVFICWGLWSARLHLKAVVQKALGHQRPIDDTDEILSYRLAVAGLILGLAVMGAWLWRVGLPLWIVPVFLFGTFVTFLYLTRAIVETGLATVTPRLIPCDLVISGIGSSTLGAKGMIAMASTFVWGADLLIFLMAPVANSLKMSEGLPRRRRPLFWAIVLAVVLSLAASLATTMVMAYDHGAANLYAQYFVSFPQYPFDYAAAKISTPSGPDGLGWFLTGIGGAVMGLLLLLQRNLLWWPLHPIGFIVAADWVMDNIWFSIFLAWLIKSCVLKYSGPRGYRKTVPFFIGLILGQFAAAGFWLVVDGITGVKGTWIPMY